MAERSDVVFDQKAAANIVVCAVDYSMPGGEVDVSCVGSGRLSNNTDIRVVQNDMPLVIV